MNPGIFDKLRQPDAALTDGKKEQRTASCVDLKGSFNLLDFGEWKEVEGQYSASFIKKAGCVKVREKEGIVIAAICEGKEETEEILRKYHFPLKVEVFYVKESEFTEFTGKYIDGFYTGLEENENTEESSFNLSKISSSAPVINIVNSILLEAVRRHVSDIHIALSESKIKIRFRVDGLLRCVKELDKSIYSGLVSRIKIMASLNIVETRLPQDGRMDVEIDGVKREIRVSVLPCISGEELVLRIFDMNRISLSLSELGFSSVNENNLREAASCKDGLVIVSGPTGSGKTTTLHALISLMDREELKVITVEDPVEMVIEGACQIQVNEETGLTFESILRRILRADPDVILVGEIRDKETAELSVRAALTGHLVLATLHTKDSVSCVTRLSDLGIKPYLISSVLRCVCAQRLLRRTCRSCGGKGCMECEGSGFKGRVAVSEVYTLGEEDREAVRNEESEAFLKELMRKKGALFLSEDAVEKVKEGITCESEIRREGIL